MHKGDDMKRDDEHSPYFDPSIHEAWEEIPGPHWLLVAIAVGMIVALLSGCDDYERELAMAEYRERFMELCMPRKGDLVTVEWVKGELICMRTTPTGRYGRTFPHTENRVAIVEGL
jgi:hypothetical protein